MERLLEELLLPIKQKELRLTFLDASSVSLQKSNKLCNRSLKLQNKTCMMAKEY